MRKARILPAKPGVYCFKDRRGRILYVGKASSLRDRVQSYFVQPAIHPKVSALVPRIADIEFFVTTTEMEALLLENELIKKHQPRYNTNLKDQKNFPFVKVTKESYPRLMLTRKKTEDGGIYFGPYTNAKAARGMIRFIEQTFGVRPCKFNLDRQKVKACVYYQMGQCPAPCEGKESPAGYLRRVDRAMRLLRGETEGLEKELTEEMKRLARDLKFEQAAVVRDRIRALTQVLERQRVLAGAQEKVDIFAIAQKGGLCGASVWNLRDGRVTTEHFYILDDRAGHPLSVLLKDVLQRHYLLVETRPDTIVVSIEPEDSILISEWTGAQIKVPEPGTPLADALSRALENTRIAVEHYLDRRMGKIPKPRRLELEELSRALSLGYLPRRIEGYDIATTQGKEPVGAQVTFVGGEPFKEGYRYYRIRGEWMPDNRKGKPDDYAMMAEMLARRCRRLQQGEEEPDLVLIDGGIGHLHTALKVFTDFRISVPVIALAKGEERVYTPESDQPLGLRKTSRALHLLMRIRDEAHRFGNAFHRKIRDHRYTEIAT
ncbi:MAG: excinuclease ABC subunit UvrC [bacterium JZ-2024 1]